MPRTRTAAAPAPRGRKRKKAARPPPQAGARHRRGRDRAPPAAGGLAEPPRRGGARAPATPSSGQLRVLARRRAPPTRSRSAPSPSATNSWRLPGLRGGQRPRHLGKHVEAVSRQGADVPAGEDRPAQDRGLPAPHRRTAGGEGARSGAVRRLRVPGPRGPLLHCHGRVARRSAGPPAGPRPRAGRRAAAGALGNPALAAPPPLGRRGAPQGRASDRPRALPRRGPVRHAVGQRHVGRRPRPPLSLSAGRHAPPRLLLERGPAGGRDGARQDRAGNRRLRAPPAPARRRARAGHLPGLAQRRVGGADRPLHEPPLADHRRPPRAAAGPVQQQRGRLLLSRQLRTDPDGRRRRAAAARPGRPSSSTRPRRIKNWQRPHRSAPSK